MNTYDKEHAELHNQISSCRCIPLPMGTLPCRDCQIAIVEFARKYGIGVLTNDLKIEELENKNSKLEKENKSLSKRLEEKNRKYEKLKERLAESSPITHQNKSEEVKNGKN
jgi:hypothetical protein